MSRNLVSLLLVLEVVVVRAFGVQDHVQGFAA
jgi:hypothetical protein